MPDLARIPFTTQEGPGQIQRETKKLLIRWISSGRCLFSQILMRIGVLTPHTCDLFDFHHFLFLVPAFLDDFLPVALFSVIPFILIALGFISPRGFTVAVLILRVLELTNVVISFSGLLVFLDPAGSESLLIPLLDFAFILTCDTFFVFGKDFFILVHLVTLFSSSSPCARSIFLALCKVAFLTSFLRPAPSVVYIQPFLGYFVIRHSFALGYAHELLSAGPHP
jgi:hypothetical protein